MYLVTFANSHVYLQIIMVNPPYSYIFVHTAQFLEVISLDSVPPSQNQLCLRQFLWLGIHKHYV